MVLLLHVLDYIVDLRGGCGAEVAEHVRRALDGQAETADQCDWYMRDVEVKSCVARIVSHLSALALLLPSQIVDAVHRLERHDFCRLVGLHIYQELVQTSDARISVL